MLPSVKIRGIYSTALTKLALDSGFSIADPSEKIRQRFHMKFSECREYEVLIHDRTDLQGIEMKGEAEQVCKLLVSVQESLLDAVIVDLLPSGESDSTVIANLELPGGAKDKLDRIRSSVIPTLKHHHRLKIIDSDLLESAEIELSKDPENRICLENRLIKEAIFNPLVKTGHFRLEHIRSSGKPMRPRIGVLQSVCENVVMFRREFTKGRYDGLDIPISNGDFGLTEIREGEWYVKHSYFSKDNSPIGDYFNINTPVEIYPFGARYVDLEVDVIQRAGQNAFAIDQEKFEILAGKGCIGKDLHNRVLVVSEQLLRTLNGGK